MVPDSITLSARLEADVAEVEDVPCTTIETQTSFIDQNDVTIADLSLVITTLQSTIASLSKDLHIAQQESKELRTRLESATSALSETTSRRIQCESANERLLASLAMLQEREQAQAESIASSSKELHRLQALQDLAQHESKLHADNLTSLMLELAKSKEAYAAAANEARIHKERAHSAETASAVVSLSHVEAEAMRTRVLEQAQHDLAEQMQTHHILTETLQREREAKECAEATASSLRLQIQQLQEATTTNVQREELQPDQVVDGLVVSVEMIESFRLSELTSHAAFIGCFGHNTG